LFKGINIVNKTTEAVLNATERVALEENATITEVVISSQECSIKLE
jgi:flagellar hook-basal body complex protein FliE